MKRTHLTAAVAALAVAAGALSRARIASATALTQVDFIQADGNVLKNGSDTGSVINPPCWTVDQVTVCSSY